MNRLAALPLVASFAFTTGCDEASTSAASHPSAKPAAAPLKVELIPVPRDATDGPALIRQERERALAEGRSFVVYVGAEWCEPCGYFHDAAAAGKLDADFPGLRILEFDADHHESMLDASSCRSRMIPLFSRPTEEGKCSDRKFAGAIKGPGAVAYIKPKLQALLAD